MHKQVLRHLRANVVAHITILLALGGRYALARPPMAATRSASAPARRPANLS